MRPERLVFIGLLACLTVSNFSVAGFAAVDSPGSSSASPPEDNNQHPAANASDELGDQLEKKLEDLESHFFGHIYRVEPAEKRIVRLERFVFGTESGGPFTIRINHIASTLSVADPDGSKREIKLHPKDPPPPAVAAQDPPRPTDTYAKPADNSRPPEAANPPGTQIPNIVDAPEEHSNKTIQDIAAAPVVRTTQAPSSTANQPMGRGPKLLVLQVTKGTFTSAGNPGETVKELDQAIRVHPSDADLMFERAKAFIQMDKLSSALNDLSDAIMHDPNKSAYYLARAWCYKKLGNSYLAADDIKQARFVDPGLPLQIDLLQNAKDIANDTRSN